MAKNVYSLQLLRNGTPFTSYTEAVNAITGGTEQDGVLKLARYTSNESDSATTKYNTSTVKTIFGIRHDISGSGTGWTIFDSYHEIIENLQNQIDAMGGDSGSIAEQIQAALDQLDFSGVTGNVVTQVTETNGLVSATGANVGTLELTGYVEGEASGHVEATDSINAAIAKLQNQIDAANEAKDAAIADLDVEDTAVPGEYVSQVTETDGKIEVTRVALPSAGPFNEAGKAITAVSEDHGTVSASAGTIDAQYVTATGFTATNVQGILEEIDAAYKAADEAIVGDATTSGNTLGKLEDRIDALDADAKEYHIVKETSGLPAELKERYKLVDAAGNVSGDTIDIPKDSHIVEINYISDSSDAHYQNLEYVYLDASGETKTEYVDMANLILETEFASGVTSTNGVAHGVVDQTSESFLTVGADGFKLAGVQAAIDAASGDVKSKLDELSGKTEALSAKTVTGIDMTGGTAAITANTDGTKKITIDTDGSKILATGYAKGTDNSAIAATDSINAALANLENQVDAAKAAATTKVEKDANASHLTIASATSVDGSVTYTIGESDIASKTDLDAEIAARKAVDGQNGDTYAANAGTNYISAATSLNDADVKLDTALKTVADSANSAQTEIDAIETAVGLNADGTHAQSAGNYTSGADSIEGEIVALDGQVKANADAIEDLQDSYISGITMNGSGVTVTDNVAALTARYTNTAAESEDGMVITTGDNGGLTFQFGTLDCGEYT
jgi:hypothetical protein